MFTVPRPAAGVWRPQRHGDVHGRPPEHGEETLTGHAASWYWAHGDALVLLSDLHRLLRRQRSGREDEPAAEAPLLGKMRAGGTARTTAALVDNVSLPLCPTFLQLVQNCKNFLLTGDQSTFNHRTWLLQVVVVMWKRCCDDVSSASRRWRCESPVFVSTVARLSAVVRGDGASAASRDRRPRRRRRPYTFQVPLEKL